MAESITDIIARVRNGDSDAVTDLDRRLRAELIKLVRANRNGKLAHRIDSEEVVNAAMRSFVSGLMRDQFDDLSESARVRGLLVRLTVCKLRDEVRWNQTQGRTVDREVRSPGGSLDYLSSGRQLTPEQCSEAVEFFERLPEIVGPVHERAMEILTLTLEGLSTKEVADEFEDLSVRSVQVIKHNMEAACSRYLRAV